MTALRAFHNDASIQEGFIREIRWHEDQDRIVQLTYGEACTAENFRACAVGCSINSMARLYGKKFCTSSHKLYEELIGVPEWLARLEETIFEGLPEEDAKLFPRQFAEAINLNADLEKVKAPFVIFVLRHCRDRAFDDGKAAIDACIALWRRVADGVAVSTGDWSAARSAAESAAWSAESAAYQVYRDELLRLMRECK